jgi:Rrf2 family transcriptional regulator, iron-sulfur cluster assembly transcription factor
MSIIFSRQCEYALQAVLYLALQGEGEMTSIKNLTRRLGIPYHFLAKILQDLSRKGLLRSLKGPTGGFALALPPKEITLFHIVDAIDGTEFMQTCVLGFPTCSGTSPCSVHQTWGKLRDEIYQMLASKTVDELARAMKKPHYRTER